MSLDKASSVQNTSAGIAGSADQFSVGDDFHSHLRVKIFKLKGSKQTSHVGNDCTKSSYRDVCLLSVLSYTLSGNTRVDKIDKEQICAQTPFFQPVWL